MQAICYRFEHAESIPHNRIALEGVDSSKNDVEVDEKNCLNFHNRVNWSFDFFSKQKHKQSADGKHCKQFLSSWMVDTFWKVFWTDDGKR